MVSARWAVLSLLLSTVALGQPGPTVLRSGDRVLVALPDSVLKQRVVRARLDSALTTTFILKSRIRGQTGESVARIEVRYDLWDEVYRVRRAAIQQVVKPQEMDPWWRTPIDTGLKAGNRATIEMELIVLPFSATEESDAREWLSKSGAARDSSSADSNGVISVLIGTTLSARPVLSYRWTAEIVR
jgi:hypothetical protein